MKTSLVFFGNERIATGITTNTPIFRELLAAGYEIEAVVINHEKATSRKTRALKIEEIAMSHNIAVHSPTSSEQLLELCKKFQSKIAVLVAYGRIIPQSVIDEFPLGIINVHPSLLPKHRGSVPIESVILQGEQETGVSIMKLVKTMDAGPVYTQTKLSLQGDETKQALSELLAQDAAKKLREILPRIADGSLQPQPQDETQATYDQRITKADGVIDWYETASTIEREVRAYAGWPKSSTRLGTVDVVITAAHVEPERSGKTPGTVDIADAALILSCGQESLEIDQLIPAGKKEMSAAEFIRGYENRVLSS